MILFLCPDSDLPVGGVKQIYRHVGHLQSEGVEAYVLHQRLGFACTWFEHSTPLAYLDPSARRGAAGLHLRLRRRRRGVAFHRLEAGSLIRVPHGGRFRRYVLKPDDTVVLPEYPGLGLAEVVQGVRVVVFNQNVYNTFRGYGWEDQSTECIYTASDTVGAVCVSDHNRRYLQYVFPGLKVLRTVNGVDPERFFLGPLERDRLIAFMPHRHGDHLEQVVQILRHRGLLTGWKLLPIVGFTEREVAQAMRSASIFLSGCHDEGFGLPPLEAAISGALVVGYTGLAAEEYFDPRFCWGVPQEDVLAFAQAAECAVTLSLGPLEAVAARRREYSDLLQSRYSLEAERASVAGAWRELAS